MVRVPQVFTHENLNSRMTEHDATPRSYFSKGNCCLKVDKTKVKP